MANSSPLAVAWEASSHLEAQILCGLLRGEGIAARVAGEELADEFAQAARLTGGLSQVLVPPIDVERARELLEAHAEGGAAAADSQWDSSPEGEAADESP